MEPQERWYAETLPLEGQVVVDVGANVGRLSEFFYTAGRGTSRVISVEPLAENVAEIRARITRVGAGERWTVETCAVSSREGEVWLQTGASEGTPHNSMVVSSAGAGRVRVPCRTLASIAPDATVVKIDIEGHEYAVLDEALPRLPGVCAWALELHMVPGRPLSTTLRSFAERGFMLFGAGRRRSDPSGAWVSAEVSSSMEWDALPVAQRRPDGSVFKMFHVVAVRTKPGEIHRHG
jgi:FkbM family methyltransferase